MFAPLNYGVNEKEARKNAIELVKLVGLSEDYLEKSPFELSGGEMRKVALCGILALNPKVLILDEPTVGLDYKSREDIMNLIKELQQKKNMTIVLVTHNMDYVLKYADKIFVLNKGELDFSGTAEELFSNKQILEKNSLELPEVLKFYKELKSKLRLRQLYDGNSIKYCVSSKYRISSENYIRTVVNDIIYQGTDRDNAVSSIKITNQKYKPENSYEKIRIVYELNKCHIYLDICPFGTFVKIVGDNMTVSNIAHSLGFKKEDDIAKHVDNIYIDWSRRMGLKEMWDVQFGLNGERTNEPE